MSVGLPWQVRLAAGGHGQNVRIEDDVGGWKTGFISKQAVGAGADGDLAPAVGRMIGFHPCQPLKSTSFSVLMTDISNRGRRVILNLHVQEPVLELGKQVKHGGFGVALDP